MTAVQCWVFYLVFNLIRREKKKRIIVNTKHYTNFLNFECNEETRTIDVMASTHTLSFCLSTQRQYCLCCNGVNIVFMVLYDMAIVNCQQLTTSLDIFCLLFQKRSVLNVIQDYFLVFIFLYSFQLLVYSIVLKFHLNA